MFIVIGLVIVFGSIVVGFTMHGGQIAVLIQTSEFIIIGGAGLGALIVANKPAVVKKIFAETAGLMVPNRYGREAYSELLQVLYAVFYTARRDGLVGIESDIEAPESSELFKQFPGFHRSHHAVSYLADTMKVLLTGAVEDHHLAEILDHDLEQYQEEAMSIPHSVARIGDAMPGFGIVAAVLGVIITMGKIGGSAEEVGKSIAAALVGTFLGVLLAYGVMMPLAHALESRVKAEQAYLRCIRTAILSFARGDPPITSVEFARRTIEPDDRPSFEEVEALTRRKGK